MSISSRVGSIEASMERNRIKVGCLPYMIVFVSIAIIIVLCLIFGSQEGQEGKDVEFVLREHILSPIGTESANPRTLDQYTDSKSDGVWVFAAFEVPEEWRNK